MSLYKPSLRHNGSNWTETWASDLQILTRTSKEKRTVSWWMNDDEVYFEEPQSQYEHYITVIVLTRDVKWIILIDFNVNTTTI